MYIFDGKTLRLETEEERSAYEESFRGMQEEPQPPTTAERLAALEDALLEMMGVTG